MVSISYCNIFNAIRFIYNPIHFPLRYYLRATEYKIRGLGWASPVFIFHVIFIAFIQTLF